MRLQDLVVIQNRYQDSVNIRLDMGSSEKIAQYIPTSASLKVLRRYLTNVMANQENATILIGPYGKGKSHLLLVLLKILWQEQDKKTSKQIAELIKRVRKVDKETAALIQTVQKQVKPYLPVIVTYGNEDLNTTYLYALTRALNMAGLEEVAPASAYQKAINAIMKWKNEFPQVYEMFDRTLQELAEEANGTKSYTGQVIEEKPNKAESDAEQVAEEELKKAESDAEQMAREVLNGSTSHAEQMVEKLRMHDHAAYQLFVKLYPQFTAGSKFSPMVEMHAMKLYEEVDRTLREEYGYAGIIIIFDEFSKYMEMQDKHANQLSGNMGVVQEMCELCARTENQMHHIFVAHKSIKEYGSHLSRETINCFTGVEGRLKEVHFTTTPKNNYELIASTILKRIINWNRFLNMQTTLDGNLMIIENLSKAYQLPAFYSYFSKEEFQEIVVEGCFPLLPVTAYLLQKISEKVGQNERSLFTFLAKNEKDTLTSYVRKEERHDSQIVGAGASLVFDYFSSMFYKETSLPHIQEEYKKARYVLEQLEAKQMPEDSDLAQVVKALALILMVHVPEEMNADKKTLQLACDMPEHKMEQAIATLEKMDYIVWRKRKAAYEFKNQLSVNVQKELASYQNALGTVHLEQELLKLSKFRYELPKAYNHAYSMTRYFDYHFMTPQAFMKLTPEIVAELFAEQFADGKMIALVPAENAGHYEKVLAETEVEAKLSELLTFDNTEQKKGCIERLVVLEPVEPLELMDTVRQYLAIEKWKADIQKSSEKDPLLLEELNLMQEDLRYELNHRLETIYMPFNGHCRVYEVQQGERKVQDRKAFHDLLSEICMREYEHTPVIRHEMINRRVLSAPMRKATTKVMEALLEHKDTSVWLKGTSAEATVYRATLVHTGLADNASATKDTDGNIQEVIAIITAFLKQAQQEKMCFSVLYDGLQGKGYGMRNGVIPIYLAFRLSQLEQMPVVYLKGKEYEIDAALLNQINQQPEDYYLYMEQQTVEKEEYVNALAQIWQCEANVNAIALEITGWFQTLSQYAVRSEYEENEVAQRLCQALLHREMNPREFVYETLKEICQQAAYMDCISILQQAKNVIDSRLNLLKKQMVTVTKEAFDGQEQDDLLAVMTDWYAFLKPNSKVLDVYEKAFLQAVDEIVKQGTQGELSSYAIISRLAKVLTDLYLEDWNKDSFAYYTKQLAAMMEVFAGSVQENVEGKKEVSFTGEDGVAVHRYFSAEIDGTAEFLQNEMLSVMEEFGDSVEPEQKVAVLMKMLEELC